MITIPLSFTFDTQEQADAAVSLLSRSFNITEADGDALEFTKSRIAALLKERIVTQVKNEAQTTAETQATAILAGAKVE